MKSKIKLSFIFLLLTLMVYSSESDTDSLIRFKGINSKIAYTRNRQLNEAGFIITNNSKTKIKAEIIKAELIRGKTTEVLNGLLIKDNQYPHGNSYIYIYSGSEKKFRILFDPFILYEGSVYSIRAIIKIDGKEYDATSRIELFRQAYGDKNKYKK